MRIFRPARQLRVQLAEGRPCKLSAVDANMADREELQGKILWSAGPWRSSGDWWAEQSTARNPRKTRKLGTAKSGTSRSPMTTADSVALYRIYRDAGTGQWFADASYD